MIDIDTGWLAGVRRCPSPNFNDRPEESDISLLVIHNISLPPEVYGGNYIEQFFCNNLDPDEHPYFTTISNLQVSAHLLIKRDGELVQFVPFDKRAWHAGQSNFSNRENCNDFSIGIELEGSDHRPYTDIQYEKLAIVTQALLSCYKSMSTQRIVGHSDIAPKRKTDPGPAFDWSRYLGSLS